MRPRVAILTNIPSPYQVELFDAITAQGRLDLRVWYCAGRDTRRMWDQRDVAHSHRIGSGRRIATGRDHYYLEPRFAGEIASWQPALAVFSVYTMPAVQLAMWRAALGGLPWVYWGEAIGTGGNSAARRILRNLALLPIRRWAAGAFGVGSKGVQSLRGIIPPARPVLNVPYFSNLERFDSHAFAKPSSETITFAYIGSFIDRKGVDVLARAFDLVVQELPHVRLLMAGDGDPSALVDPHLSTRAAERVQRLGFVNWNSLPTFYRRGDFLVMPSRYDGWGMVVPEAMACGLPVIGSTGAGAVMDLVRQGMTGWHVPPGDVGALAEAMFSAARMPQHQRRQMQHNCLRRARRYDAEVGARVFDRAVRTVLRSIGTTIPIADRNT